MPRQRAAYLFAEGPTFHDVVESQRKRVAPEVDAVDPKELVRRPREGIGLFELLFPSSEPCPNEIHDFTIPLVRATAPHV